jgi:hypothetical protein
MPIPTPTLFIPDGNYTVSPWTDYYLQTMNETIVNQHNEMLAIETALLVCVLFLIGILLTIKLRRSFQYGK